MKKSIKILSPFAVLLFGLFLTAVSAHADLITRSEALTRALSRDGTVMIVGAGVVVAAVAWISWRVIRAISNKKKKNGINK
jgi:uncharacterized membrane protein YvlD (DUF360 family)